MDARVESPGKSALRRVLRDWSGVGTLFRAFADMSWDGGVDREWSEIEVKRRALRVLLLKCSPALVSWPGTTRSWDQYIEISRSRDRFWSPRPMPGVRWAQTRRRGWPPTEFRVSQRRRTADVLTLSVLAWTIAELVHALDASDQLTGPAASGVTELQVEAVRAIRAAAPLVADLAGVDLTQPTSDDLRAVARLGWPWTSVSEVARILLPLHRRGLHELAEDLIVPDGFPEVVLQLETLGMLLMRLEASGAQVVSAAPIAYMTSGPVYSARWPDGPVWDIWCEAAGAWDAYGATDSYRHLSRNLRHESNPGGHQFRSKGLRPDILIAEPDRFAAVVECKYSAADPGYISSGLPQAYFYAAQLRTAFDHVEAWVVGPERFVPRDDSTRVGEIDLGITNSGRIEAIAARHIPETTAQSAAT